MSIKTTYYVTREFAIEAIERKLNEASDEQLATILEEAIHNGFYNFRVVTEDEMKENADSEYPSPSLTDLNNLPEYNDVW